MSFRFMQQHGMKSWILFFAIAAVVAWGGMACAWWYSLGLLREAILESSFLEIWQSSAVQGMNELIHSLHGLGLFREKGCK